MRRRRWNLYGQASDKERESVLSKEGSGSLWRLRCISILKASWLYLYIPILAFPLTLRRLALQGHPRNLWRRCYAHISSPQSLVTTLSSYDTFLIFPLFIFKWRDGFLCPRTNLSQPQASTTWPSKPIRTTVFLWLPLLGHQFNEFRGMNKILIYLAIYYFKSLHKYQMSNYQV